MLAIMQAEYDSVAMVGLDEVEEYALDSSVLTLLENAL